MAHKKGGGNTKNGRDSNPKFLGFKKLQDHEIKKGEIILKQKGIKFKKGKNVGLSKDFSLYSLIDGFVVFYPKDTLNVIGYL